MSEWAIRVRGVLNVAVDVVASIGQVLYRLVLTGSRIASDTEEEEVRIALRECPFSLLKEGFAYDEQVPYLLGRFAAVLGAIVTSDLFSLLKGFL